MKLQSNYICFFWGMLALVGGALFVVADQIVPAMALGGAGVALLLSSLALSIARLPRPEESPVQVAARLDATRDDVNPEP